MTKAWGTHMLSVVSSCRPTSEDASPTSTRSW